MSIKKWYKSKDKFLFWTVAIGLVLRVIFFISNLIIGGVHIDESMLFANALSVAKNGTDLLGNKMPAYFATWLIGGQSPLGTYLSAFAAKIFGNSLFALRLPALIIGCAGVVCSAKLGNLLFCKKEYQYAFAGLAAVSPWMIFSSCFVLDCNYMGYNLIFGILMLLKGQKQNKNICYVLSMFFFSLCFYSYIASVLVVPIFLAVTYLLLLTKKKIKIGSCVVSVISLLVFSIPFIIFGLVLVGKIEPFATKTISFPDMKFYSRDNSIALNSGGVLTVIKTLFKNFCGAISIIGLPDSTVIANGANLFQYGNLGAGLISVFGIIDILLTKMHKKKIGDSITTKSVVIASGVAIAVFCAMTNTPSLSYAYRYGVLTPLLLIFEAIGLVRLIEKIKSTDIKKLKLILTGYLTASLIIFGAEFFILYNAGTSWASDSTYGDSLKICLDESDDISPNDTTILCSPNCDRRTVVYLYYYRHDKNLNSFYDSLLNAYTKSDKLEKGYYISRPLKEEIGVYTGLHPENAMSNEIKVSDTITISNSDTVVLTKKCYIVQHSKINLYNHKGYKTKENGFFDILIKE